MDKRPIFLAAIFFLAVNFFTSCEKPEESIGIDLQPDDDLFSVNTVDTFTVVAYTLPEDSIRTESTTPALVGAYIDPVFGLTKASHYTELRLTSANPVFGTPGQPESVIIDSLILNLAFSSLNGNVPIYGSSAPQYFQIYEIDDTLSIDEVYYSNQELNVIDEDLVAPGSNLIETEYRDSTIIDGVAFPPSIRIPLKKELGRRFIDEAGADGLTATEFIELFNGMLITVDEDGPGVNLSRGGIISIDNFTGASRMEMYYRDTFPEAPDTAFYDFAIRSNIGKYNAFSHDFQRGGTTNLIRQVVDSTIEAGKNEVYIQAMAGTKIRLDFPYLQTLKDSGNLAISKAELILPAKNKNQGRFTANAGLFIFGLNEDGDAFFIDDQLDGISFVGGAYDPINQEYRFIISRFLQQVISGQKDFYGLEIVTERAASSPFRVVLNGTETGDPEDRIRLKITFTKF
jgi:hypothetical protein